MEVENILQDLTKAFEVLTDVGSTTKLSEKQDILSSNCDNDVLKNILYVAYSPFIQYNMKKIPSPASKCIGKGLSADRYAEFLTLLKRLNLREITGNAANDEVSDFLTRCSGDEYQWYTRVIKKDLRIGLADKGINKVFKKLIPQYDVMLADKIQPEDLDLDTVKAMKILPDEMVVQYKIDGYRLNLWVYPDRVEVRTRNGKTVTGYNDLESEALEKLPDGFVYDGEIVSPELFDWIESNKENSESTAPNRDLFSEAISHAFSHEDNKQGIFNMFDMVPMNEWKSQKPTETLKERTKRMVEMVDSIGDMENIRLVPTSKVFRKSNPDDMKSVVDLFHYFISIGWEGAMIKNWNGLYEWKRTKNLLKMKLMDTIDLEVIDIFEGEGKYKGMMGGVICDYKGYNLGVGSGWKDDERISYWENKQDIIGKTIEVAYQAETSNKDGGLSLSFPVVKAVRNDK